MCRHRCIIRSSTGLRGTAKTRWTIEAIPALGSASNMPASLPGERVVAMSRGEVRDKRRKRKRGTDVLTWDCGAVRGTGATSISWLSRWTASSRLLHYSSDYTPQAVAAEEHLLIWLVRFGPSSPREQCYLQSPLGRFFVVPSQFSSPSRPITARGGQQRGQYSVVAARLRDAVNSISSHCSAGPEHTC